MKSQTLASAPLGIRALFVATAVILAFIAPVVYLRAPIRSARQIQQGDTVDRFHQLLGAPTTVFESDADLRRSELGTNSFVFADTTDAIPEVSVGELPVVTVRAEWFEYTATAGHLVYYNDEGVEVVFWGGT